MAGDVLPITVVIPAYDRAAMTTRAVRSALGQQPHPPAEVIVVDDHSSDGTAEQAERAGATVVRRDVNGGCAIARQTGVEAATQPWLAFLDSDDRWLPHHLATLWPHVNRYALVASSSWAQPSDGSGRKWGAAVTRRLASPADVIAPANPLTPSTVLLGRERLRRAGGFRPLPFCEDLDAWIRLLETGPGLLLADVTVVYGLHDGQMSGNHAAMYRAHRAVSLSYRDRAWFTRRLARQMDAALS